MKRTMKVFGTVLTAGTLAAVMAFHVFAAQITKEKAQSIALENAGVTEENVTFIKNETDREDGRLVYEIEFLTSDFKEYDYEIDAETGIIISRDYEIKSNAGSGGNRQTKDDRTNADRKTAKASASDIISLDAAKAAALDFAGLEASEVTWAKIEQDYDDGYFLYEGKFFSGSKKYEFEIDGATGAVIEWETKNTIR